MASPDEIHEHIFLFTIEHTKGKFAKFASVLKRDDAGTRDAALEDIKRGRTSEKWTDKTSEHAAEGLDMKFARNTHALIFVQISTKNPKTVFGPKKVADADIERKGAKIVAASELHPFGKDPARLCSFQIRLGEVLSGMGSDGTNVGRLPIMFDYVDTDTDLSPVLKGPHEHPIVSHGGIHPPTATTMIELTDDATPQT